MPKEAMDPQKLLEIQQTYSYWAGVPTFLRSPHRPDMSETDIGLIGFPYCGGNPVEHMQHLAPRAVRNRSAAYRRIHRKFQTDPFAICRVSDLGDVLDPACAPAVADPEVNGMTTRELFALMNKLRGLNIVGADIVCFCPPLDNPGQITALTASEMPLQFVTHVADFRAQASAG